MEVQNNAFGKRQDDNITITSHQKNINELRVT